MGVYEVPTSSSQESNAVAASSSRCDTGFGIIVIAMVGPLPGPT